MNKEATVELINVTENALDLLIFTKSGRLSTGTTLEDIGNWSYEKKMDHLSYMMDTIQTSFEFVDYTFSIKNVSRAFTHQLVRTRTASYQQQAMRVVDARDFTFLQTTDHPLYKAAANYSLNVYGELIDDGIPVQDARGVLPTAIHTEIFFKANLRTLSNMAELRLCKRAEGEYQKVFKMIVKEVLYSHKWAEPLLQVHCVKYGVCAFPRYKACPVQKYCLKPEDVRADIKKAWEDNNHVANPISNKEGMTM